MASPVADAIAHYDELLAGSFPASSWAQDHVSEVRKHWQDIVDIDSYVLRPFMIDEATYAATRASLELVMRGFTIATDRLAADSVLRRKVGIPEYVEPLLEIDRANGRPTCLGRLDGLVSDGVLTLLEFNSEPMTPPFQYELERSFEKLPIAREFARRFRVRSVNLYDELFDTLRARGKDGRPPCVAILDKALWKSPRKASRWRHLMSCSSRGVPLLYVEPEELEYRSGQLTSSGIRIDMVAFAGWDLLINARKRLGKVLKAIADGVVDVFAGLSRGLLASYKVLFELLSSPEYRELYPPEVAEALARHVPWTRVLREMATTHDGAAVDLLPFVADNRERLVIKPAGGGGGGNVTIGRDVTADAWTAAIRQGSTQNWIVQQLATPERQHFPVADAAGHVAEHELNCELTPYVWNGQRIEGALCRVSSGSVLHDLGDRPIGISNGIETATWIVDR